MAELKSKLFSRKKGRAEIIAFVLFVLGVSLVSSFHEHWFDEAQAWQIARSASFSEILTVIPHYEGHPPLWHLILAPVAKLGAPYHLSMCLVNVTFISAAAAVLLFRSPFPKAIRCTLPFTYFFFYQFGVVCRPYSIMTLAFMLMAMTYRDRNSRPWRYILAMLLLCLSTTIGLVIAGGLCLAWTFEILPELKKSGKLCTFWKDKRFLPLLFILLAAVGLLLLTKAADDCYYDGVGDGTLKDYLLYWKNAATIFYLPVENWFGTLVNYSYNYSNDVIQIVWESAVGAVIWAFLIILAKKNGKLLTFLLPYGLYAIFMGYVYGSAHHYGIGTMIHIFLFWIMAESPEGIQVPEFLKKAGAALKSRLIRRLCTAGLTAIYLMNVAFSCVSAVNDIRYQYAAVSVADFIKEHHLEDRKIMVSWLYDTEVSGEDDNASGWFTEFAIPSNHDKVTLNYTNITGYGSLYLPYFDRNIFMNYNVQHPDDLYMHYAYKEDVDEVFRLWHDKGLPDFIIGYCPIDEIFSAEELKGVRYSVVGDFKINMNYKFHTTDLRTFVYMRDDLADEYPDISVVYDPRIAGEYVYPE